MITDRSAPVFYVKIYADKNAAGTRLDVTKRVLSFSFDDDEKKADKLALTLDNFDLSLFDDPLWKKGNRIEASWGYAGRLAPARECVIQSIKGFTVLTVEALAKSILMNKEHKARVFDGLSRAEIVRRIAAEHGYGPTEQFIDDTKLSLPHVSQARMTDAQFIKHLAAKEGFEFYVDFEGFHFHPRRMGTKPVRTFIYYIDPELGDVMAINVENDVTAKPSAVKAKGRDPIKKTDIDAHASNETTKRDGTAPTLDSGGQLQSAEPVASYAPAEATSSSSAQAPTTRIIEKVDPRTKQTRKVEEPISVTLTNASSAESAKREADGKFVAAQQVAVQLAMTVVGDPNVSAKMIVEIQNISKRLSGKYYVKQATHKISGQNYVLELKCRSDGHHGAASTAAEKSKADPNKQSEGDKNALVPVQVVDPRTKTTHIEYRKGPLSGGTPGKP